MLFVILYDSVVYLDFLNIHIMCAGGDSSYLHWGEGTLICMTVSVELPKTDER